MAPTTRLKSRQQGWSTTPPASHPSTPSPETPDAVNGLVAENTPMSKKRQNSKASGSKVPRKRIRRAGGSAVKDILIPDANIPTGRVDMQTDGSEYCHATHEASEASEDDFKGHLTNLMFASPKYSTSSSFNLFANSVSRGIMKDTQSLAETMTQNLLQCSRAFTGLNDILRERDRQSHQDRLSTEGNGTEAEPESDCQEVANPLKTESLDTEGKGARKGRGKRRRKQ
ncbi:hypothetical protein HOY82DRAFT_534707 [Tuber indicum]|nr:hypothetical protein HOY82DRAFT_534707 [Tuber indicum]